MGVGELTVTTKLVLVLLGPSFTVTVIVVAPGLSGRRCYGDGAVGAVDLQTQYSHWVPAPGWMTPRSIADLLVRLARRPR